MGLNRVTVLLKVAFYLSQYGSGASRTANIITKKSRQTTLMILKVVEFCSVKILI